MANARALISQNDKVTRLPTEIANEFQAAMDGMKNELSAPLAYKVVHNRPVTMRTEPSVYAAEAGRLSPGDVVRGFPAGAWLCVLEFKGPLPRDGAWVLIDGTPLGVSNLLVPVWAELIMESIPEGLRVQWPGIAGTGFVYYVQWLPKNGIEGRDGGTVIAMQPKEERDVVATISGIESGTQVRARVVACLSCGLLVGPWSEVEVTSCSEVEAPARTQAESIPADVLQKESDKYAALVKQLQDLEKDKVPEHLRKANAEEMRKLYEQRPSEGDKAKEMVLSILFGGHFGEKAKAAAEGQTGAMFEGATAVYEEGLAGECNAVVAEVIATLVRKHG